MTSFLNSISEFLNPISDIAVIYLAYIIFKLERRVLVIEKDIEKDD